MGKTAFISGASRGIGRAAAERFAGAGYNLHLTCIHSGERLDELKKGIEARYPVSCRSHICDMGDYEAVSRLFGSIGELDVLVNNAGISYVGLLTDMSVDEWHRVVNTNLSSLFYTCKSAVPLMLKKKAGRIINISSVWGNVGASMETAYSASKGGVNSFTKALAKELAPSHICVNAVAFGVIDTDMNRCFSGEERRALAEDIPAGRFGTPEEAAELILHVAEAPEYMTGQIITMDGGWC